jgi:glutaminyl-peptide cyclotransferase
VKTHILQSIILVLSLFLIVQCAGDSEDPIEKQIVQNTRAAQLTAPLNRDTYDYGDDITAEIQINDPSSITDLKLTVNGEVIAENINPESQTISFKATIGGKVGWYRVSLSYTDKVGKEVVDNRDVAIFSDLEPESKKAIIANTYPHAKTSYTQGLEFYKGQLFEGTGQYNQSILTEVDLETGDKIREKPLQDHIFGEGITILNDTIYQITYRATQCYVYDMDFNLLSTMNYYGEGWGLCNDGQYILMSNGSSKIVWRDSKSFEIVKELSVFDNQTEVVNLNELELINGDLYVNLYQENRIAQVDTSSGKVLTYIDCKDLALDAKDLGNDVLNGIAHNPETGKTYMTGKWWPKLYEVIFE